MTKEKEIIDNFAYLVSDELVTEISSVAAKGAGKPKTIPGSNTSSDHQSEEVTLAAGESEKALEDSMKDDKTEEPQSDTGNEAGGSVELAAAAYLDAKVNEEISEEDEDIKQPSPEGEKEAEKVAEEAWKKPPENKDHIAIS